MIEKIKHSKNFYELKNLYNFLEVVESSKIVSYISDVFSTRSPIGSALITEYSEFTRNIKNQINKILNEIVKSDKLKEFTIEMSNILEEKFEKYKDSWKTTSIGELRPKIGEQMKGITDIIMTGYEFDREKVKRKLLHIANYCFFLYNRLE
ncbi:hypothetical protein LCGC14_1615650 [marine sediment metagenome]|uniref:Uncharacterized protein n=1 Tax=marine sediment metagenome TaxID=412755 RepID=A0A0F9I781_9ZZZZ